MVSRETQRDQWRESILGTWCLETSGEGAAQHSTAQHSAARPCHLQGVAARTTPAICRGVLLCARLYRVCVRMLEVLLLGCCRIALRWFLNFARVCCCCGPSTCKQQPSRQHCHILLGFCWHSKVFLPNGKVRCYPMLHRRVSASRQPSLVPHTQPWA